MLKNFSKVDLLPIPPLKGEQELLVGGWDNGDDLIEWGTRFHSGEDVEPERRLKENHSASKTIVPVLINDLSQKSGTLIQVPNSQEF